jgi:hypothetical protein
LNDLDMASFPEILELDLASPSMQQSRPFNYQLRYVVTCYGLQTLFNDDGPGPYHHAIRPTGYDFHLDVVLPAAMERVSKQQSECGYALKVRGQTRAKERALCSNDSASPWKRILSYLPTAATLSVGSVALTAADAASDQLAEATSTARI